MSREDLAAAFHNYDVIVSASLEEGTHCVIAEGMLSGLYPLIRAWDGASELYPPECIWENMEDLKEKLMWWASLSSDEKWKASQHYRLFIQKRYDYREQASKVVDVIEEALARG